MKQTPLVKDIQNYAQDIVDTVRDPVILESQGFPIGLAEDAYEERSVGLGAGDRLYSIPMASPKRWTPPVHSLEPTGF